MNLSQSYKSYSALILFLGSVLLLSCSRTKDKVVNRYYHQLTSKYNPLYNGQKAYKEAILSLKQEHTDSYDVLINVTPYGKSKEGTAAHAYLKKAIEKATKTIKEHSMMFRGVQKNPIVFDAYLLLGDAQAAMGLDISAQESYAVVIRNAGKTHRKHKAELSRIKVLADQGNSRAVQEALDEIQRKGIPEQFLIDINILKARAAIIEGELLLAAKLFEKSARSIRNRNAKSRMAFLAGQLYEDIGERPRARSSYNLCVSGQPETYDMLLEASLRRTLNGNIKSVALYKELNKLLKEPKNREYRDRIYYSLANVAKNKEDKKQQLFFLSRCIGLASNERPTLKAIAYSERGEIYFNDRNYSASQVDLDSAFLLLPKQHQLRKGLEKKRKGLNFLVKEMNRIDRNDSLLALSNKSESALRAYFSTYIEGLKEQEMLAIKNAKINALNAELQAKSNLLSASAPTAGGSSAGGWLFYNPIARASGISAFSAKWGQRPNVDNWRLQSASGNWSMTTNSGPNLENTETGEEITYIDPIYNVETYLMAIPTTEKRKDSCREIICKALIASSAIYRDQIGDYDMALAQINRLISFCPDDSMCSTCDRQSYALYALYRLRLVREEQEKAERIKNDILERFPESLYAKTILGTQELDISGLKTSEKFIKLTGFYKAREWASMLELSNKTVWNELEAPRAALLYAHAIGGKSGEQQYIESLTQVEKEYPGSPQAVSAGNIKMALATAGNKKEENAGPYKESLSIPHQLIIILSKEGSPNDVRNALARFHQKYFAGNAMSIRPLPLGDVAQIITIDGFKNASEVNNYRTKVMRATTVTQFLKPYSAEYWPITVQNFSHFYTNKDIEGYRSFVKKVYGLK